MGNKGRFSGYGKQIHPFFQCFELIDGITPSISTFFNNIYELSGYFPSIY